MTNHPIQLQRGQFGPGSLGCHEALDRTSLLADWTDDLSRHPAILLNKEWRDLANDAAEKLADLYQKIGSVHLGRPEPATDEEATSEVQTDTQTLPPTSGEPREE